MASLPNCHRIWTIEEDEMLKNLIVEHGTSNWTKVGESFPERTGKQCRERWYNHLDPCVKKGEWTSEVSYLMHQFDQKESLPFQSIILGG